MAMHLLTLGLAALLAANPFALLGSRAKVTEADRRNLERGATVSGIVPGGSNQIAVFAIMGTDVAPETLLTSARSIEDLKRSSFVQAIHRFSDPPQIDDLSSLVLSPRDIAAATTCVVGNCSFKLTASEIAFLQQATRPQADRDDRIQRAFRQVVLDRVTAYLAGGLPAVAPIVNRGTPWCLDHVYQGILSEMPRLDLSCAPESFLYWSQETYGPGKPVVLVTQVGLIAPRERGDPAIVIGKQIMATHYMTGGVSITAITTDPASGRRYLVYVNRTGVDLLGGVLGPIKRSVLESRLKREVPQIIEKLRQRLEQKARPDTR